MLRDIAVARPHRSRRRAGRAGPSMRDGPRRSVRGETVGKMSGQSLERPRITIHSLMWFVLIVALVNGLVMMVARRLRATAIPIEQSHQQEVIALLVVNAYTFLFCVFSFYDPWWRGKSRHEWFRRILIRMPCWFLCAFSLHCIVTLSHADGNVLRPFPVFIVLFVLGPLPLAVGFAVEIVRVLRSRISLDPTGRTPEETREPASVSHRVHGHGSG